MIIAMNIKASRKEIDLVISKIEEEGLKPLNLPGSERTVIGVASSIPPGKREPLTNIMLSLPGVDYVKQVSRTFKLASREFQSQDTVIEIKNKLIGSKELILMAGPCAIESEKQLFNSAEAVKKAGASVLRGGAYKPRSSPYSFQGLGLEGLKLLKKASREFGLITVTEVLDQHEVERLCEYVDILQIGARNMQNFPLLIAVGKTKHPVLLKRGLSASIDELLLSAEYILNQGNPNVILCERGVHPLDKTYIRSTLDISSIPIIKELSHLPIIVDPSHAAGRSSYVPSLSKAAVAAGADGLIIEVHPDPKTALCDGSQSLTPEQFSALCNELKNVALSINRNFC